MSDDLQFIQLNERAYRYIRQFTIKSPEDALIELITNCIDAYNKGNIINKLVEIEYLEQGILKVRDYAIGLNGQEMSDCFLQVGNFTNVQGARGFFSRGAKDISAIADLEFHAIKDNKYSKVILNNDAYGKLEISDIDVTDEIRTNIGIASPNNGLLVVMKLLPNFYVTNPSDLAESISKLAVLRDIMSNVNNTIYFSDISESGDVQFKRQLIYTYPPGSLILDLSYVVPGYPSSTATWKVYKSVDIIEQPKKDNEMRFGFLIKDDATIYEVGTIDDRFRWNPYMPYLYGELKCNTISDLLYDYDINGASPTNPVPIIDPSRLTGTNKKHPFIDAMLSIPRVRLDQMLRELNSSISQQSISLSEISDLFDELEKYGLNLMDDQDIKVTFVPSYDSKLAKAIEDDRLSYVTVEKNYLLNGNYTINKTSTDKYVEEQLKDMQAQTGVDPNAVYVLDDNNNIIRLPNITQHDDFKETDYLALLSDDQLSNLQKNPYIYQIGNNGELIKIYVFQKGKFEQVTNPENDYLEIKNKKFRILFINDINITKRYIIEYDDGITIKLNLNDDMIKKYIVDSNVASGQTDLSIANMTSTKSLVFLKELIIQILSDIILENDVINGKIMMDSTDVNNIHKMLDHQNQMISKVQIPIENIFDKYITNNVNNKVTQISSIVGKISDAVASKLDMAQNSDLLLMKETMINVISNVVE